MPLSECAPDDNDEGGEIITNVDELFEKIPVGPWIPIEDAKTLLRTHLRLGEIELEYLFNDPTSRRAIVSFVEGYNFTDRPPLNLPGHYVMRGLEEVVVFFQFGSRIGFQTKTDFDLSRR